MKSALVLIDIQMDYFPGGTMALEGPEKAAAEAAKLLAAARERGLPICHIQHAQLRPGANFLLPGTPGAEIHPLVAPAPGERVFAKHYPNSFRETELSAYLAERGITDLFLAGMMTHMCVDTTTRAAFDAGYRCILAHDASATRALAFGDTEVPAAHVHAAYMAALGAVFAEVVSATEAAARILRAP